MCFFNSVEYPYLEPTETISTLRHQGGEIFQKTRSIVTGKQCARKCSYQHRWFYLKRYMCFFHLGEWPYLEQNEPLKTWKILICRKYSFQRVTEFSHGNNVLQTEASSIDGFLRRDICFTSTQLKRTIWIKHSLSPPCNAQAAGSISYRNTVHSHMETIC
jgi:hypothetical protein